MGRNSKVISCRACGVHCTVCEKTTVTISKFATQVFARETVGDGVASFLHQDARVESVCALCAAVHAVQRVRRAETLLPSLLLRYLAFIQLLRWWGANMKERRIYTLYVPLRCVFAVYGIASRSTTVYHASLQGRVPNSLTYASVCTCSSRRAGGMWMSDGDSRSFGEQGEGSAAMEMGGWKKGYRPTGTR